MPIISELASRVRFPVIVFVEGAITSGLCLVHDAAMAAVKFLTMMHCATVIPNDNVANLPLMPPLERRFYRMRPEFVEKPV